VILLCSDGLTEEVSDQEIASLMKTVPTNELPQALIETAKTNGGSDNITVILGLVEGSFLPDQVIEAAPEITGADSFKDEPLEESVTEQA
jgi:hypothetical protein